MFWSFQRCEKTDVRWRWLMECHRLKGVDQLTTFNLYLMELESHVTCARANAKTTLIWSLHFCHITSGWLHSGGLAQVAKHERLLPLSQFLVSTHSQGVKPSHKIPSGGTNKLTHFTFVLYKKAGIVVYRFKVTAVSFPEEFKHKTVVGFKFVGLLVQSAVRESTVWKQGLLTGFCVMTLCRWDFAVSSKTDGERDNKLRWHVKSTASCLTGSQSHSPAHRVRTHHCMHSLTANRNWMVKTFDVFDVLNLLPVLLLSLYIQALCKYSL